MPIDAKKLLDSFDGPKVPTLADSQKESAQNAEKKGNYQQAIEIYQQMLERDENNAEIFLALADALRKNGEYEKAIAAYDNLIKKDAKNLAAKEGKGLALVAKGDFETPTAIFEEVIKADGKRWKSINGMGILFVTRNLYHDAQKYFEEALKQRPNNVAVLNNLGLVQALNKQFGDAIQSLSKASENSTIDSLERKRVDLNLALIYGTMGKIDEAEKIAKIYLSGAQLSNNMGLYAHLAKDDQMAKSYLNMALTESKTYYSKAWDNLAAVSGTGNSTSNSNDDKHADSKEKTPKKDVKKSSKNKEKVTKSSDQKDVKPEAEKPAVIDQSNSDAPKDAPKEVPKDSATQTQPDNGLIQLLDNAKSDSSAATVPTPAPTETKPAEIKIIPTDKTAETSPKIYTPTTPAVNYPNNSTVQSLGTIPADLK